MDLRVTPTTIQPLLSRIAPDQPLPVDPDRAPPGPTDDAGRFLVYTAEEQTTVTDALHGAGITYKILAEDQPDPALLEACQGRVATRSEALAALAAGRPPATLTDLEARMESAEARLDAAALSR
jgi:hypothetical protein